MERLLNFMISLRRLPPLSELSGDEERLLFELRGIWQEHGTLSVSDAYGLAGSQSVATAHRRLMALRDKGLVEVAPQEQDRRKRRVTFTAAAENLFASIT